ncbi:MAG: complex I NDUFA9 subunit family protein [Betaproteobacteria bacterium]
MKHILVLGGTGFVGSHVCEKLIRAGLRVTVLTRRAHNARAIQHLPALTVLECNVHNEAALTQALSGVDAVVNLVAVLHGSAAKFERVHVALPAAIARACQLQGVRHLVHVSALGADHLAPQTRPSNYLRSKGRGEMALIEITGNDMVAGSVGQAPGVDRVLVGLTLLRPSVIFGAHDQFLNVFAKLQRVFPVMPLAGAQARFQPVWVQDVAQAVVQSVCMGLAQAPQLRILELVGPQVYSLRQLVHMAACMAGINQGRGRPVIGLPRWMGNLQAAMLGLMPGEPLMSSDNLDSMRIDNVASGDWAGLEALGIAPASLLAIAPRYLAGRRMGPVPAGQSTRA